MNISTLPWRMAGKGLSIVESASGMPICHMDLTIGKSAECLENGRFIVDCVNRYKEHTELLTGGDDNWTNSSHVSTDVVLTFHGVKLFLYTDGTYRLEDTTG